LYLSPNPSLIKEGDIKKITISTSRLMGIEGGFTGSKIHPNPPLQKEGIRKRIKILPSPLVKGD